MKLAHSQLFVCVHTRNGGGSIKEIRKVSRRRTLRNMMVLFLERLEVEHQVGFIFFVKNKPTL